MHLALYSQHVLGVGHFFRSLEICRALSPDRVTFITGGREVGADLPENVTSFPLSPLAMDRDFSGLFSPEGRDLETVKKERAKALFDFFQQDRPDVFFVELFPFGRKAFSFELLPVLQEIREGSLKGCRVACGLRDILVEKRDPDSFEMRVLGRLNPYFHALLVHSDPDLIPLSHTFSRTSEILPPIHYTGFVGPHAEPGAGERLRQSLGISSGEKMIVASAGSGAVGEDLLFSVVRAFSRMDRGLAARLFVFTGPHMGEGRFKALRTVAGEGVRVSRFSDEFLSWLDASDLSVSMAGYNTCMNLAAVRANALVHPFSQNREQRLRAEKMGLAVVDEDSLEPGSLARTMEELLERPRPFSGKIRLDGAKQTAKIVRSLPTGH